MPGDSLPSEKESTPDQPETINSRPKLSADEEPNKIETEIQEDSSPAPAISDKEIAADLLEQLEKEKDRVLRIAAEFENYKKRAARDAEKEQNFRMVGFVASLLPVLDNLERALKTKGDDIASYEKGIELTLQAFRQALSQIGIERIDSMGKAFNPEFHEALATEEKVGVEDGTVIDEFETGYKMGSVVLRPARVRIARNILKADKRAEGEQPESHQDKTEEPKPQDKNNKDLPGKETDASEK